MVNLTQCGQVFLDGLRNGNATIQSLVWSGPVTGIYDDGNNLPAFISYSGCVELCGQGPDFYSASDISATVSTWILPIIGLLLQAPFESSSNWETVLALCHWIGNPISSLAAIFWNIKACNMCALVVDMAMPYNQKPSQEESEHPSQYSDLRDAFYLLSAMNQYTINRALERRTFERLLRVTLFSDSLMLTEGGSSEDLVYKRRKLAAKARLTRKRGVVPVFITFMWFLFSFGVSLAQAFALLGFNAEAHDLALGLLMSWIPIFVLSSIVDRNPTQPAYLCNKINKLVEEVRFALLNPSLRGEHLRLFGGDETTFDWIKQLTNDPFRKPGFPFFTRYAGQGRVRWHYGISHDILQGIEEGYVSAKGRNWMKNIARARTSLILGPDQIPDTFTRKFDFQSLWQIFASFFIVSCSVYGAFIISYLTPTRGLSCRSVGYLVFWVACVWNLLLELAFWNFIPREGTWHGRSVVSITSFLISPIKNGRSGQTHRRLSERIATAQKNWAWYQRDILEKLILRPLEAVTTVTLVYIVLAQAIGLYRSCYCSCSVLSSIGGYMDFESAEQYLDRGIATNWGTGVALTGISTTIAFAYIVHEWCTQSHLSTLSFEDAARGLVRTRRWQNFLSIGKKYLYRIEDKLNEIRRQLSGARQPSLVPLRWSRESREEAEAAESYDYGTESTIGLQLNRPDGQARQERDITSTSSSVHYGPQQDISTQLENYTLLQRRPILDKQGPLYESPAPSRSSSRDSGGPSQDLVSQYPFLTFDDERSLPDGNLDNSLDH